MPAPDRTSGVPSAADIRAELAHMIDSEMFRGAPQLAGFLRFVVVATLRG
jgi:hypothetical protein